MCMCHGMTGNKQAFCLSSAPYHTTLAACALLASWHQGKPASVLLSRTRVRHITPHFNSHHGMRESQQAFCYHVHECAIPYHTCCMRLTRAHPHAPHARATAPMLAHIITDLPIHDPLLPALCNAMRIFVA